MTLRGTWERVWSILADAWKAQRAAYRWCHGGKCAPEIYAGIDPRFLPATGATLASPGPNAQPKRVARVRESSKVPVANTFVHFKLGGGSLTKPRCGSEPDMDPAYIELNLE